MSIFCKHEWSEEVRTYYDPMKDNVEDYHLNTEDVMTLLVGAVSIFYVCKKCGEMRQITLRGKVLK